MSELLKTNYSKLKPTQKHKYLSELVQKKFDSLTVPKDFTPRQKEMFFTGVLNSMFKNPKLFDCDPQSLFLSIRIAGELGLMPSNIMGEGYFIPYGNKCEFVPGYKGLRKLAFNKGTVSEVYAKAVYKGDEFDYAEGLERYLIHKPDKSRVEFPSNEIEYVYAVIKYNERGGGSFDFEVLPIGKVEHIRKQSKGGNNPVWKQYYEKMAVKTVLRSLLNQQELSAEVNTAVGLVTQSEVLGERQDYTPFLKADDIETFEDEINEDARWELANEEEMKAEAKKAEKAERAKNVASSVKEGLGDY